MNEILADNTDKESVIGTHGTALSTILNSYDNSFGCEEFLRIIDWMPYIIELDFEGDKLANMNIAMWRRNSRAISVRIRSSEE